MAACLYTAAAGNPPLLSPPTDPEGTHTCRISAGHLGVIDRMCPALAAQHPTLPRPSPHSWLDLSNNFNQPVYPCATPTPACVSCLMIPRHASTSLHRRGGDCHPVRQTRRGGRDGGHQCGAPPRRRRGQHRSRALPCAAASTVPDPVTDSGAHRVAYLVADINSDPDSGAHRVAYLVAYTSTRGSAVPGGERRRVLRGHRSRR